MQKLGIMDYSLLTGVHMAVKGNDERLREGKLSVFQVCLSRAIFLPSVDTRNNTNFVSSRSRTHRNLLANPPKFTDRPTLQHSEPPFNVRIHNRSRLDKIFLNTIRVSRGGGSCSIKTREECELRETGTKISVSSTIS